MVKIYFIEANISGGKTTLINNLRKAGHKVFHEPLDDWQNKYKDDEGRNILQLFYDDMEKWSFQFEVVVMMTRYTQLKKALESGADVVFVERSILTDRYVFAKNLYEQGKMKNIDWTIYMDWYHTFTSLVEQLTKTYEIEYIYLQVAAEKCYDRKNIRGRKEEENVVPDYFNQLHDKHEEWLTDDDFAYKVNIVDGELEPEKILVEIAKIINDSTLLQKFKETD